MIPKSNGVGVIAAIVCGVVIISFFWKSGGTPSFSFESALAELKNPRTDERAAAAMRVLRASGDEALPHLLDLYRQPPKPESKSYAETLLTSLSATPKVVSALVELIGTTQDENFKQRIATYLTEASGQRLGSKADAWKQWWEREGKTRALYNAPYGTQQVGGKK